VQQQKVLGFQKGTARDKSRKRGKAVTKNEGAPTAEQSAPSEGKEVSDAQERSWSNMRSEFEVQKLIWESAGHIWKNSGARGAEQRRTAASLTARIEAAEAEAAAVASQGVPRDEESSARLVAALEAALPQGPTERELLSRSMQDKLQAALCAERGGAAQGKRPPSVEEGSAPKQKAVAEGKSRLVGCRGGA
jgi:hypothetical protein